MITSDVTAPSRVICFEGLKVHGAPEHVIVGGKVAVYEYQLNSGLSNGRMVSLPAFPPVLYDAMDDFAKSAAVNGVERSEVEEKVIAPSEEERKVSMAGVTTPRRGAGGDPVLNKRLGNYQRPVSAHGVRNQQGGNSTLLLQLPKIISLSPTIPQIHKPCGMSYMR